MEYSTNAKYFEAMWQFRNAFVRHVRKSLQEAYPSDWLEKLKAPFQKEWDKIVEQAKTRRATHEMNSPLVDDFDCLSVNHFHGLIENYFTDLFPQALQQPEDIQKQLRKTLLRWAAEIKNLRDPALGHPAENEMEVIDAQRGLMLAQKLLEHIDPVVTDDAAERVKRILDDLNSQGIQAEPEIVSVRDVNSGTLPARETIASRFTGREAELRDLREWLDDPYSRTWVLAGDGGKGKTAIAYEFA
ncbi:MAG: hypothetical protein OXK21_02745, partial [Chloroflexota bacterium]|nr:hypothetical protein [Chloroflexota bacterium]